LYPRRADAGSGPQNQNVFARTDVAFAYHHAPCRQEYERRGRGFLEGKRIGNRQNDVGRHLDQLRIGAIGVLSNHVIRNALACKSSSTEFTSTAADARIDGHTQTGLQIWNIRTNFTNDSRCIGSGNLGKRYFDAGHATAQEDIDMVDRRGMNFDEHFAAAWRGVKDVFITKHVGCAVFVKNDCFHDQRIVYPTKMIDEKSVSTVVVIGAGIMGSGIAHVAALGGFKTILNDVSDELLQKAREGIDRDLQKGVELGKIDKNAVREALNRLSLDSVLDRAAKDADLIIEAVPEKIELKVDVFARLDAVCGPHTVFASNTSALSITEMAGATKRADRFIGMHFFNPVHKMKLVEIIRGLKTSDATLRIAEDVSKMMGKETVEIKESPGFVTSRMNALIGNEAFYMLQEGVASARDIDKALKLGLNHPMGPFEMIDLVGLDTRLSILKFLHER
jgi:3-hydroxybutyryl-CoA dehydrogenase